MQRADRDARMVRVSFWINRETHHAYVLTPDILRRVIDEAGAGVSPTGAKVGSVGIDRDHAKRSSAAGIRLRPILMTTAAMVFGVIPLITATGAGAVSRFNMGLVIASGLSIGTLFTLFVVPAVDLLLAIDHARQAERDREFMAPTPHGA